MTAETLVPLDVPPPSMGAPLPMLVASDSLMSFAYFVDRAGSAERDLIAVVRPWNYLVHTFGAPDENGILGHRPFEIGMQAILDADAPAAEVLNSQWIVDLERMHRVQQRHGPVASATPFGLGRRHFVFPFHDS